MDRDFSMIQPGSFISMHNRSFTSANAHQRGTILIATMIVVFVVAGMSAVMIDRSRQTVLEYRQQERVMQAKFVAESAVSMAVAKLNDELLPDNPQPGDLSDDVITFHSGDGDHTPIRLERGATQPGHSEHDRMDNDDDGEIDEEGEDNPLVGSGAGSGSYAAGLYRVEMQEWVTESHGTKDGAKDLNDNWTDDDGDGDHTDNETNEVSGFTNENSRKFTIKVTATYGNYTVDMRAFTNALQTDARKFAIYSEKHLEVKSKTVVDSYDSSIGPYGGGNQFQEGNLAAEGDVTLKPNAVIKGDVHYGDSIDWDPDKTTVTGEVLELNPALLNQPWSLTKNFQDPTGTKTVNKGTFTVDQNYKSITVRRGGTLIIPGGKTWHFGDFDNMNTALSGGSGGGSSRRDAGDGTRLAREDRIPYRNRFPGSIDRSSPHPLPLPELRVPQSVDALLGQNEMTVSLHRYPFGDVSGDHHPLSNNTRDRYGNRAILTKPGKGGGGGTTDPKIKIGPQAQVFIESNWLDGADSDIVIQGPQSPSKTPTRIFIAGNFETNNRTDLLVDGWVQMYVIDRFYLGPKSSVSVTNGRTPHFSVSVGGTWNSLVRTATSNGQVDMQPKTDWMGHVHAPTVNEAIIKPKGEYFGDLVARNIELKPQIRFHYDESIAGSCGLPGITCRWVADNINSWVVQRRGSPVSVP